MGSVESSRLWKMCPSARESPPLRSTPPTLWISSEPWSKMHLSTCFVFLQLAVLYSCDLKVAFIRHFDSSIVQSFYVSRRGLLRQLCAIFILTMKINNIAALMGFLLRFVEFFAVYLSVFTFNKVNEISICFLAVPDSCKTLLWVAWHK